MTVELSCNKVFDLCFNMQLGIFKGGTRVAANDNFANNVNSSRASFLAEAGVQYTFVVDGIKNPNATVEEGNFFINYFPTEYRYDTNFDALDSKTDFTVFRPTNGAWYSLKSVDNQMLSAQFGQNGDTPVPADYDGDGATDYAVVRNTPQGKMWYVLRSASKTFQAVQWGIGEDFPLVGDYDADGVADLVAVRKTAQGLIWYIKQSSTSGYAAYQFGSNTDQPVAGNFVSGLDSFGGLRTADLAVVRTTANNQKVWFYQTQGAATVKQVQFGVASDINIPFDYDNDGFTDIAVWRPSNGTWYYIASSSQNFKALQWGAAGDIPQPGRFGGSTADIAVYRPSNGTWYINYGGTSPNVAGVQWGSPTDRPVASLVSLMNP